MNNRLKALRKHLGLSQITFAKKIAMSQQGISMAESGVRQLTDRQIITICAVFGVSKEWLLTGNGEMFPVSDADDELIEAYALIGAKDVDPRRKRLAKEIIDIISSMPDESLNALQAFFQSAANVLTQSTPPPDAEKKAED